MISRLILGIVCTLLFGCGRSSTQPSRHAVTDGATKMDQLDKVIHHADDLSNLESPGPGAFTPQPEEADLIQEDPEANPLSESVLLTLSVSPPTKAVVMRGQKVMARLVPAAMQAEWTVPRGGGPMDLEIRADGFLPFHTRLYSDRDDKLAVRLYRAGDAVGLWGYRPPSVGK